MCADNVVSIKADTPVNNIPTAKLQQLTSGCQGHTEQHLMEAASALFDKIDDELYTQAEKSLNDTLQTSYFVSMRELRVLRETIIDTFHERTSLAMESFLAGNADTAAANTSNRGSDELSLLAEDELEEDLAVTNIISKTEKRCKVDLEALNKRLAWLCGYPEDMDTHIPISPGSITEAFRVALDNWEGNLLVKLVIYKLFDKYVMSEIGSLYRAINDELATAGVLPKLPRSVRKSAVSAAPAASKNETAREMSQAEPVTSTPASPSEGLVALADEINALVGDQRSALGLPSIPVVVDLSLPKVDMQDVVDVLGRMQASFVAGSPFNLQAAVDSNSAFKQELMEQLGVGENSMDRKQLDKPEQHIIDVVMMLFDFVLDDPMMADPMKVLLGRLQIPMLRAAVADRDFLGNKYHPARSLLNNLGRAAVRWEDDDDRSERSLYGQIEMATARVVRDFDGTNLPIFEQVDREFMSFVSKEVRGAKIAEERLSQIARGQEQLAVARKRVSAELSSRMGYELPTAAFRILDEGWRDVLTLTLLREGEDSPAWQRGLKQVDDLVESVTPQQEDWKRQKVMRGIPVLLKELRAGFKAVSYDPAKTNRMFKELQVCHINALRGQAAAEAVQSEAQDTQSDNGATPQMSADSRWVASLEPEQWMIWELADGSQVRAKLIWKSCDADLFLFTNRKGRKVLELSQADLIEAANSGLARPVNNIATPIIDRALKAIARSLKGQRNAGLSPSPA